MGLFRSGLLHTGQLRGAVEYFVNTGYGSGFALIREYIGDIAIIPGQRMPDNDDFKTFLCSGLPIETLPSRARRSRRARARISRQV